MNFDEIDADIQSLEKSAKECTITDQKTYEGAQHFSQSISHITIWLNKLLVSLADANKVVTKKMGDYEKGLKAKSPSPNACVACGGSGKASSGTSCKPCNGTGKKVVSDPPKVASSPAGSPEPNKDAPIPASAPKVDPAPPSLSLDDFDDGPVSEEQELAVELKKSLF